MRNIVAGIDIGSHAVRVVVARHNQGVPPQIIGVGVAPSKGVRHGYVTDPHATQLSIQRAIAKAEKSAQTKIRKAYVAMGGISLSAEAVTTSVVVARGDGEVTQLDIDQLTEQAQETLTKHIKNKKIIHAIPLAYTLDGEEILGRPVGMQGVKLGVQMLFVTALEHHFDNLIHACDLANVSVMDVIASPLALSMPVLSQRQKVVGSVLIDIGCETTSMAVFENDALIALHVANIGSADITNDIALGCKVQLDEAERIKREGSRTHNKKVIQEIIQARLEDVFEIVEKQLKQIKRSGLLPAGAIISGGGAVLPNIEDFAVDKLKLPVAVIDANATKEITLRVANDPAWLIAYGLCYLGDDNIHVGISQQFGFLKDLRNFFRNLGQQFLP